jgi:hypothetical protein
MSIKNFRRTAVLAFTVGVGFLVGCSSVDQPAGPGEGTGPDDDTWYGSVYGTVYHYGGDPPAWTPINGANVWFQVLVGPNWVTWYGPVTTPWPDVTADGLYGFDVYDNLRGQTVRTIANYGSFNGSSGSWVWENYEEYYKDIYLY